LEQIKFISKFDVALCNTMLHAVGGGLCDTNRKEVRPRNTLKILGINFWRNLILEYQRKPMIHQHHVFEI